MKKTVTTCDISNRQHLEDAQTIEIDVIFDHDQEDGKTEMEPYLSTVRIEICHGCLNYMFHERRYIYAYGAMGYNTYSL